MLATFPASMNIILLNKIPSNSNINAKTFHHDIVEKNCKI